MSRRGDEAIWRVAEVDAGTLAWREVQPLVRCRDCVDWVNIPQAGIAHYCRAFQHSAKPDDFCSYGEKKGDEDGEQ